DYPSDPNHSNAVVGSCAPGGPPNVEIISGGVGSNNWTWIYSTKNWTAWNENNTYKGPADAFLSRSQAFPDSYPNCATNLDILLANPQQVNGIEVLVGTRSLFKFCIRLDPSLPNSHGSTIEDGDLASTAYISNMSGVDLMNDPVLGKAVGI